MERRETIHTRVTGTEKRRITDAASTAGRTTADFLRDAVLNRITGEQQADRLMVALTAAVDDHVDQLRRDVAALSQQQSGAATKADLTKLAEWLITRLTANREGV